MAHAHTLQVHSANANTTDTHGAGGLRTRGFLDRDVRACEINSHRKSHCAHAQHTPETSTTMILMLSRNDIFHQLILNIPLILAHAGNVYREQFSSVAIQYTDWPLVW